DVLEIRPFEDRRPTGGDADQTRGQDDQNRSHQHSLPLKGKCKMQNVKCKIQRTALFILHFALCTFHFPVRRSTRPPRAPVNRPSRNVTIPFTRTWTMPAAVWLGSNAVPRSPKAAGSKIARSAHAP